MFLIWRSMVTDCPADVLHGALGHVCVTANVQALFKRPAVIMCPEDVSSFLTQLENFVHKHNY